MRNVEKLVYSKILISAQYPILESISVLVYILNIWSYAIARASHNMRDGLHCFGCGVAMIGQ